MKPVKTPPTRYNLAARCLHWLMAVLLLATLFIGAAMGSALQWRPQLLNTHLVLGVSIFIVALLRIGNRLLSRRPLPPAGLSPGHRLGLALVHLCFYALMTTLPLMGWAMLSAGGYPTPSVLGIRLPALVEPEPKLYTTLHDSHAALAYGFFALILLHLAAALFHAWVKRDGIFTRMGFGSNRKSKDD